MPLEGLSPAEPFHFVAQSGVVRWTGYIAEDLPSLLDNLRQVPPASIYYHVYYAAFWQRRATSAEYLNDFARWVATALGQKGLAERLASVDPIECTGPRECAERLAAHVQDYVGVGETFYRVPSGKEFYFLEVRSFLYPTGVTADSPAALAEAIRRLGSGCILNHFIDARFRYRGATNDFSQWLRLRGEEAKAAALERLNPFFYDLAKLQEQIVAILRA
ncbi:MAG: hypothetical protein KatS3mg131_3690 [Candidatus Tectimicrobiota bacterium]|nr:MAG: hypothetical protein KatS3mg131_3690 [Candidatus Tectomicrobia bacterium]